MSTAGNTLGGGKRASVDLREDMATFDRLPRPYRDALNYMVGNYAADSFALAIQKYRQIPGAGALTDAQMARVLWNAERRRYGLPMAERVAP